MSSKKTIKTIDQQTQIVARFVEIEQSQISRYANKKSIKNNIRFLDIEISNQEDS